MRRASFPGKRQAYGIPERAPLPLDQDAELVGEWWLPGEEEQLASGRLVYTPDDGLRLELVSGGAVFKDHSSVAWVHGLTVDGRRVTLRDCDVLDWRLSMPGGVFANAQVGMAFVGMHANSEIELRLHSLEARIANLSAWIDAPAIDVSGFFPRSGTVAFRQVGPFGLARRKGVLMTAAVDLVGAATPTRTPRAVSLHQQAWLKVAPSRRAPFEELFDLADAFRGFLSFAAGVDSPFLELEGTATVVGEELGTRRKYTSNESVWILFRRRQRGVAEEQATERMLFRYSDMQFKNYLPLARWLRRTELMEPVYNLYLAALPRRSLYLEYRFLAFVQALEAFYFRKHGKEGKLQALVQSFVDALPRGLRTYVPGDFAELVKDTRHYLTHWNPKYEAKAAKGDRLFAATRGVKLLFELALLREVAFPQREIQRLVENNQRLVGDVQASWGSL